MPSDPTRHSRPSDADGMVTPAFVYDEADIVRAARGLKALCDRAGCRGLSTLKPLTFAPIMRLIAPHVSGFSASSLFEARLARDVLGDSGSVHITTPGFRPDEIETIAELCDAIAFNSLPQFQRLHGLAAGKASCGLRVNPQLSFVPDDRYNPCRAHSKLGAPLDALERALADDPRSLDGVDGIHFHNNCDASDLSALLATVRRVDGRLGPLLARLQWVNLGGGYLFANAADDSPLIEAVGLLKDRYDVEVFVEPGAALVRSACRIVSTVIDIFDSGGKTIAVLDTSVNHMAEVFEYLEAPPVAGETPAGEYAYTLAGCTCLAGDLFGEHRFDRPLEVGDRLTFPDKGAYTMVKWQWFNGVNIPNVYAATESGDLILRKRHEYDAFYDRCGGSDDATA